MEEVNKEHANEEGTSITVREDAASDFNRRTDEEEQVCLENAKTEQRIAPGVDSGGKDEHQSPPGQGNGSVTLSPPSRDETPSVELVNTTEDAVTVRVRYTIQGDHSVLLSSLAAFEVKDARGENGEFKFVVGIPNAAKDGAVQELVEEIKTVLEVACRVEARPQKIADAAAAGDAAQHTAAPEQVSKLESKLLAEGEMTRVPLSEQRRAREAHKLSQAGSPQSSSEAISVARSPSRGKSMANKAREGLGWSGQDLPQIQEQFGEAVAGGTSGSTVASVQSQRTGSLDTAKGIGMSVESEAPQRSRQSDTTPGAFYTSVRVSGALPEWRFRSSEERPAHQEGTSPSCRGQLPSNLDISEVTVAVKAFEVDESITEEHLRQRILEETVEADLIDQVAVKKRRRNRRLVFIVIVLVLVAIAIGLGVALSKKPDKVLVTHAPSLAPSASPTAATRPTLEKVRSRGVVSCGTIVNRPGLYAYNNETKEYEGFNVDLCRAIAAAAIGDYGRVEIVPIPYPSRFKALFNSSIDVLARVTTHTMSREVVEATTGTGFSFSVPFLYSGLVFIGQPDFVDCAEGLDRFFGICGQLKICVNKGGSYEKILDTLFPSFFLHRTEFVIESFVDGICNVVATEPVYSPEDVFEEAGYSGRLKRGTLPFSREPLALVTRRDDPAWSDLVNAVLQSLVAAEAQNVTQLTAATFRSTPALGNFREETFSDAIAAVGNYGEMFSRHLTGVISRTGLNSLNLNGSTGLLYSFPFGASEDLGPEPVEGGTLQAIRDRGYVRCGLSSNVTGFAEFNASIQEWSGLDVSFCRVVASAVFADDFDASHPLANISILDQYAPETDAIIEFVSLSDINQYVALADGRIDVLAGGMACLVNDVQEPTSSTGFSFSSPYFYGSPDGNLSNESTRSLVTRQDDSQWSTFVYWTFMCTIFAEERVITRNKTHLMPIVNLFGGGFSQMFRAAVGVNGNYGDIYDGALKEHIPRAGRNQLNSNEHHGPQQYPYMFL